MDHPLLFAYLLIGFLMFNFWVFANLDVMKQQGGAFQIILVAFISSLLWPIALLMVLGIFLKSRM
ncbi:MAG: hypothetical protein MK085_07220 [Phycisphaerales bacterium]|nr:hypothetical protein [Phycisphaerales bacterium]